jgi:predicted nucleic acid-binding protein
MVVHADSSYLIDLLREQARGREGRATAFLETHASDRVLASVFVVCELEAGAAQASSPEREQARLRGLLQALAVVYPDERFGPTYGETLTTLQRTGKTVDTMDLLIATAALVEGASLLTGNRRHFEKIPGLRLLDY